MDGLAHAARSQHANATMNATSLLTGLGIRYGTDKVQHNYLVVYDDLFAAQRLQVRRMLAQRAMLLRAFLAPPPQLPVLTTW